jgi:hypothetical protein
MHSTKILNKKTQNNPRIKIGLDHKSIKHQTAALIRNAAFLLVLQNRVF